MTTYDDDFVRLRLTIAMPTLACKTLGLEWPPPERLYVEPDGKVRAATEEDDAKFVLHRLRYSEITDEQRAGMTHVARGAEYAYEREVKSVN